MHTVDSNIKKRFYGFEMFEMSWFASQLCSPTHNEFSFFLRECVIFAHAIRSNKIGNLGTSGGRSPFIRKQNPLLCCILGRNAISL